MEFRFDAMLCLRSNLVTKNLIQAILNVHPGAIWPVGSRFPTPVLRCAKILKTARLSFLYAIGFTSLLFLRFHHDLFNKWDTTRHYFLESRTGYANKTPNLCNRQFCRMAKSVCRMNWHSALSKSVGIFSLDCEFALQPKKFHIDFTESFLHYSNAFYAWTVTLRYGLHVGVKIFPCQICFN